MYSPACILSQKQVLIKNLQRFLCRLANGIIMLNVYQTFSSLRVITSSVSFEHVGSLTSDCNLLLDSNSFFFVGGEEIVFCQWAIMMFQLVQLLFSAPKPCSCKGENPLYILFLFCDCRVYFFIQLHKILILFFSYIFKLEFLTQNEK